jgi:hypothetical protein
MSAKISPQHFQNIRMSMQYAYNSSMMQAPTQLRSLTPEQALLKLPLAAQEYGTKHAIQEGQVHVTVADMGVKSYSPYGSWLNMYFPFGKDEALRGQF